ERSTKLRCSVWERAVSLRNFPVSCLAALLALALTACGSSPSSTDTTGNNPPPAKDAHTRADALVAQMTQAQKLQMVEGGVANDSSFNQSFPRGAAGYIPGIAALKIPDLYFADGSVGVGNGVGPATALPSSIASAAGWDATAAFSYGQVFGTELADFGINVNLGGNTNLIAR